MAGQFAKRLSYGDATRYTKIDGLLEEVMKMLTRMLKTLKSPSS